MSGYWVMKTFKDWEPIFEANEEIGLDEDVMNKNYLSLTRNQADEILGNPRLIRRFDQFSKWAKIGDYVIVGTGQQTKFNLNLIGRITGEYEFNKNISPYRHSRKIEVIRKLDQPIVVEKWSQIQRIESIDHNDFIDTLVHIL